MSAHSKSVSKEPTDDDVIDGLRTLVSEQNASIAELVEAKRQGGDAAIVDKIIRAHRALLKSACDFLGLAEDIKAATLHPSR